MYHYSRLESEVITQGLLHASIFIVNWFHSVLRHCHKITWIISLPHLPHLQLFFNLGIFTVPTSTPQLPLNLKSWIWGKSETEYDHVVL